jgi:cell division control protein 45
LLPLSSYFTLPKSCHLHIIDAHRPWNLQNLFGLDLDEDDDDDEEEENARAGGSGSGSQGRIWVWGDGEENELGNVKKSWEALEVSRLCERAG